MTTDGKWSILGRGKVGKALAAAWGDRCRLLDHGARPDGWVILAVPDHAIGEMAGHFQGRALHLSGSLHIDGLPCLHPLTSFDGEPRDWQGTPLAVTGDAPGELLDAFSSLGFLPFALPAHLKPLYHACAVLSSGHAATLWLGAAKLLREAGVALPGQGLRPLAEATLRNVFEKGEEGKSGPFVRGDETTIKKDQAALPPGWRDVFLSLGRM